MLICRICNKEIQTLAAVGCHVKTHNLTAQQYYSELHIVSTTTMCFEGDLGEQLVHQTQYLEIDTTLF